MITYRNVRMYDLGLATAPLSWLRSEVGSVSIVASDAVGPLPKHCRKAGVVRGFLVQSMRADLLVNRITSEELPVEFFNHQLLEVDPDDAESVREFISRWGMPFSPFREPGAYSAGACLPKDVRQGIEETTWLEGAYPKLIELKGKGVYQTIISADGSESEEEAAARDRREDALFQEWLSSTSGRIISEREASDTIRTLQGVVRIMARVLVEGDWDSDELSFVASVLNTGSCNDAQVTLSHPAFCGLDPEGDRGPYLGGLSSAICNQIVECIADPAPWKTCACDGCGRVFKRKQTKSRKPDSDSIYCCDACMERQKKRNQRKAAKSRVQH